QLESLLAAQMVDGDKLCIQRQRFVKVRDCLLRLTESGKDRAAKSVSLSSPGMLHDCLVGQLQRLLQFTFCNCLVRSRQQGIQPVTLDTSRSERGTDDHELT